MEIRETGKEKIIAVVGRPNVGKSTLINRILGARKSIVHDMPGVTRDRVYFDAQWLDRKFTLIDTGGIIPSHTDDKEGEEGQFLTNIFIQAKVAMDEADTILFVVDAKSGLSPYDKEIANLLRERKEQVVLVANKVDNVAEIGNISEFYALGLGEPQALSALHGSGGVGDLLDKITSDISSGDTLEEESDVVKIAIVGKPNAGKSSILNKLLKKERAIVSDIAGTTRDSINSGVKVGEREFILIDTAGIRKKAKVDYGIEAFAVDRAIRAIREADVALLVLDAEEGLSDQDKKIAQTVVDSGCGLVLAINKWDLLKNVQTHNFEKELEQEAPFLNFAPKIFISAKTGQRVEQIFEEAGRVADERAKRVPTALLNKIVGEATDLNPPPSVRGKHLRVYYTTQVRAKPPTFVLFINHADLIKESYKKYLTKKLREAFGFFGSPIKIAFREKTKEGK
ncbi:ribosome-associated GTPase EngA [Candidatus Gastranaerophilus sp. (ex Termes propinquus)]|nr:ribosome-associated GTPase EngA [Candidatus Gastranaerophilus sp. (ex Termes propinquus)]